MPASRQLWLLAGGNGAGKSTFYRLYLEPRGLPFVNADLIARELFPEAPEAHSYEAARLAEELRQSLLAQGQSFCFETVFSHPSKLDFLGQAKACGYEVVLVFIHLADAQLNMARVAQRVSEGGHAVPDEKVAGRLPRTQALIRQALPLCDEVWLLDNASAEQPFKQVARLRDGRLISSLPLLPDWVVEMLG